MPYVPLLPRHYCFFQPVFLHGTAHYHQYICVDTSSVFRRLQWWWPLILSLVLKHDSWIVLPKTLAVISNITVISLVFMIAGSYLVLLTLRSWTSITLSILIFTLQDIPWPLVKLPFTCFHLELRGHAVWTHDCDDRDARPSTTSRKRRLHTLKTPLTLFIAVKVITKLDPGHIDKFETKMKNEK